ncbi:MAG: CTP synthase [Clostridia bacterium]|nr:CTP synthase [Clostridia bacterium]
MSDNITEGKLQKKYIFVIGGVVSGLGKGITASSLGRLLKARGLTVTMQKFDPYINIDPGTMSPYQHGEVYVTEDGAETDLDLGHYERFIDENLTATSNITTGKVYWSVITKERNGEFAGKTVQVIPHITNEIKSKVYSMARETDSQIVITEIGGTVGDIESLPFLEAIRQVATDVGRENCMYIYVTLVPKLPSGEQKTKPTQHSVKELLNVGIWPDILVCRSEDPISKESLEKLSMFCNVPKDHVISNLDAETLYEIPLMLEKQNFADVVLKRLNLTAPHEPDLSEWTAMVDTIRSLKSKGTVKVGLVGKYVGLHDAYLSVVEALKHGGIANSVNVDIEWIDSEDITPENADSIFSGIDAMLIPGGFGDRGTEGKICAAKYARVNNIPYFGICLGMQIGVIEIARNVLGLTDATSTEFNPDSKNQVIHIMPDQLGVTDLGGTLRLGAQTCNLKEGTKIREIYGEPVIRERHRHRYEVNNDYREMLESAGVVISGLSPDGRLVDTIELKGHPWYIGVQFHPEFKSRPNRPHKLFASFIKAGKEYKNTKR